MVTIMKNSEISKQDDWEEGEDEEEFEFDDSEEDDSDYGSD